MKKILVAVAGLLVAAASSASAQGGGGRMQMSAEQRTEMAMSRLFDGITLTDAQKSKATAIIKESMEGVAGIDRQSPEGMAKRQELSKKRNAALRAILTSDDDGKKFDENVAKMGRGRGGP